MADNNKRTFHFTATAGTVQDRTDRWLAQCVAEAEADDASQLLAGLSRSQIKRLIVTGCLTCDGEVMGDPSSQVRPGAKYALTLSPPPSPDLPLGEDLPLDILFEDDHIIVINKAAGMVVHPAPGADSGTLVNALIHHCGEGLRGVGTSGRPGIVHRLDKDTSGVMVAAKSPAAQQKLGAMFAKHHVTRQYTALVWGLVNKDGFTINAPITRHPQARKKMAVSTVGHGRAAITHVSLIRHLPPWASLIQCRLETGRTHQIRVHLTHSGHSVIGDAVYGRPPKTKRLPAGEAAMTAFARFSRQALHASHLGFHHPITGEALAWEVPLPPDMARLLAAVTSA